MLRHIAKPALFRPRKTKLTTVAWSIRFYSSPAPSSSLNRGPATPNICLEGKLTHSHVIGTTDEPLYNQTIGWLTKHLGTKYASNPAVISVHQDVRLTYAELDRKSDILAVNVARQLNVKRGDRVAVCSGNSWEYPVLQLGLAKLGAVLVPLNPAFTDTQFHAALNNSQSKALIIQSHLSRGPRKTSRDITGLIRAATDGNLLPSIEKVVILDSLSAPPADAYDYITLDGDVIRPFDSLMKWYSAEPPSSMPELAHLKDSNLDQQFVNETINMQFTSGTTAMPKISCLTHRNLVNNGELIGVRMNLLSGLEEGDKDSSQVQDKICAPVPMFHCFGLILTNMAIFSKGAAVVYASETFDARSTLQAIRQERCTGLQGVPTMFSAELELEDELAQGGHELLRKGIAAGTSIPVEMMERLNKTLNLTDLTICYGMTETSPVSFMTTPQDTLERRCETVGTVMPHTEAKIIKSVATDLKPGDPELCLDPVPVNVKGEILISGYLLQKGYHNAPEKTAEAMVIEPETGKTWMRTGDEGMIDEFGYLRVTGRIKDLIIRGGENLHPLEIENVLFRHPAVSQASVVGVPDPKYGEAVAAFIQLHDAYHTGGGRNIGAKHGKKEPPTPAEIREWVTTNLGHYMAPKYVWYVPDFPKTASGKIRKVDLKGTAMSLIGQGNNGE